MGHINFDLAKRGNKTPEQYLADLQELKRQTEASGPLGGLQAGEVQVPGTGLPENQQQLLNQVIGHAGGLLEQGTTPGQAGALQRFSGQNVPGQTPQQAAAFQGLLGQQDPSQQQLEAFRGLGTSPDIDVSGLQATAQGDFLNANPFLNETFGRGAEALTDVFNTQIRPGIDARFARSGRTGSPASDFAQSEATTQIGKQLSGLASDIFGGNFQQERGRQFQAQGLLPQFGLGQAGQQFGQDLSRFGAAGQLSGQGFGRAGSIFDAASGLSSQDLQRFGLGLGQAGQQFGMETQLANQPFNQLGILGNLASNNPRGPAQFRNNRDELIGTGISLINPISGLLK